MTIPLMDLKAQYISIKAEIDAAIRDVIDSAHFIGGPMVTVFEIDFAAVCGQKYCVGVGNGTDAIYLSLRALGVGPGDEVLVPANTFIATSEAVTLTGARVILVDVNETTATMDPVDAAARITPATKAIIPVHLYGRPADMNPLMDLAQQHGLVVVEDAAQAHLAKYQGRSVGSFGHACCFSFYPGKNLGAYGDGGAVVTNDADLADEVRRLANHGRLSKFGHEKEGINSRLDSLQAAVLKAKLPHLATWTEARRQVARAYNERLNPQLVVLPEIPTDDYHVFHLYVIRFPRRDDLKKALADEGVSCGLHYPQPLHSMEAYRYLGLKAGSLPMAERLCSEVLSLPMYAELTEEQISKISEAVNRHAKILA